MPFNEMKYIPLSLFSFLICYFTSCKKPPDNCAEIQQVRITGAKNSYYIGDTINLNTNLVPTIALFIWDRNNNPNSISGNAGVFIYPCSKSDEGWYYLHISYPDCAANHDSVYISVKNRPATPPCSPANNTVSFSSIPNINLSSVTWGIDINFNRRKLRGYFASGYPDLTIYFNLYWNTKEPEDGEYDVAGESILSDNIPYTVHVTSSYSNIIFRSNSGKVYISHVNGKIQAKFCGINLSATNGASTFITTTATGSMTLP